ncbi:MAG: MFS transporter, partial [Candidatus Tectomicrobia bacterium]|nr:MFS transporter [Candidatus Tectomicrobia bacterium]
SFFISLHQLAFAVDMGFDAFAAATVLGVGSLLTIGGILTFGMLSDHLGRELSGILAYVISILGGACALFITGPSHFWLFWLHACLFGVTWGTRGPLITAKSAELFRGRNLGRIFGVISIGTGIGSAVGTWTSGWIFDVYGSYRLAFILSIVSYLAGCALFWLLRRPAVEEE